MSKELQKSKFGRCIDCKNFILAQNKNMNESSCKVKPFYITKNALKSLYCNDFELDTGE